MQKSCATRRRRKYSPTNPLEEFTREDYKSLGGEKAERKLDEINILTVDEARRLLMAAHAHEDTRLLAMTVLRLFCGVRTKEVSLLNWQDVHWLDLKPYVHISAAIAKKRNIRHIDIPASALAWLKLCNPPAEGRIDPRSPKQFTKRFAKIARLAKIGKQSEEGYWVSGWENNDTRHSFGSYHYALHGDAIATAKQMGHKQDDTVLFSHYRSLVTKERAEEFFGILPRIAGAQPIQFPVAARAS